MSWLPRNSMGLTLLGSIATAIMATSVVMIPVTDGIPVHIIYQLVQRQLSRKHAWAVTHRDSRDITDAQSAQVFFIKPQPRSLSPDGFAVSASGLNVVFVQAAADWDSTYRLAYPPLAEDAAAFLLRNPGH